MSLFVYLLFDLLLLLIAGVIWLARPSLRRALATGGLLGILAGCFAEIWYLQDYWYPSVMYRLGPTAPEDVLFGVAICSLGAVLADAVWGYESRPSLAPRRGMFIVSLILMPVAMLVFNTWLGINSILVSMGIFALVALAFIVVRPDLFFPALRSGATLVLFMSGIYAVFFILLWPTYWEEHWLLEGTPLGTYLWPGMPWTEAMWYLTWGMFAGIAGNVATGSRKVKRSA